MDFWKLHGAGNDFILIDNIDDQAEDLSALARLACNRRFGVGADGLIAAQMSDVADIRMVYFNSDGTPAAMCGNGIRCFSKFVRDRGILMTDSFSVETDDGIKQVSIRLQEKNTFAVQVEMGTPGELQTMEIYGGGQIYNLIFMHIGVPHCVIFVDDVDPWSDAGTSFPNRLIENTDRLGPLIEKNPSFPEGTNVDFVQVVDDTHLLVSTWERGAGRTWACGTGACASAVAAHHYRAVQPTVHVRMPGGEVTVSIAVGGAVLMEGPAELICKGTLFI